MPQLGSEHRGEVLRVVRKKRTGRGDIGEGRWHRWAVSREERMLRVVV
jgi:hypothetical protein